VKNRKCSTVATAFSMAFLLAASLPGTAPADPAPRQISVTGQGRTEVAPDMATITAGVTSEAAEAAEAMAKTSRAVRRVLARLEATGIAPRDVQTRRLSLDPVWSNQRGAGNGPPRITGFVASNTVMIRVRDLDGLGAVLDALVADGANDFNGLQFSVQDPAPLAGAARRAAVADAIARAELLAAAAGVRLGAVMSISDRIGGRAVQRAMNLASVPESGVPVAAGEVVITASVSMVFAIED
jgi:uncharacterized protein